MKKRDIILDFTSLLDVTLIVIFFFVLFSHLDSQANKARIDEKEQELETAVQQAERQEAKAKALEDELLDEISTVKESDKRQGSNANEIIVFNRSDNIKIILDMESDLWRVRVISAGKMVDTISKNEKIDEKLIKVFESCGYTNEDTVFCDFVYNGLKPGSYSAYRTIKNGLNSVLKRYSYLYISETDLSIGE